MNNEAIARRFYRLAALMEIRGDDPFRLRSYRNAAEAIEVWPTPLKQIARDEGGKVVAGGERLKRGSEGFYFAPALITETTPSMRINREEVFGPVASVMRAQQQASGAGRNDADGRGYSTAPARRKRKDPTVRPSARSRSRGRVRGRPGLSAAATPRTVIAVRLPDPERAADRGARR